MSQGDVLEDRPRQHKALVAPLTRHVSNFGAPGCCRAGGAVGLALERDAASAQLEVAEQSAQQIALAGAREARNTEDLAAA